MQDCPSGEEISRYLDGESEPGRVEGIAAHLEACPRCRAAAESLARAGEVLQLAAPGRGSPVPPRLDRRIAEKYFPPPEIFLGVVEFDLSSLHFDPVESESARWPMAAEAGAPFGAAALVPVEKVGEGRSRLYRWAVERGGIQAALEFFPGEAGGGACRIAVRDAAGRPRSGVRLKLERDGRAVWSVRTRSGREAVFPRLLPGRYRLKIEDELIYSLLLDLSWEH